jgi:hypothetical protein
MQHSQLFIWLRKSNKDFSYTTFPVKKNKRWKILKIIIKSLFNYSFYSHPEIKNFRVWHVATTKILIQELRDQGWTKLISDATSFCMKQGIVVLDVNGSYANFFRSRASNETTLEHHYRYDIFTVAINQQPQELSEQATELLILCTSLNPSDSFSSFNIDKVYALASRFYPTDFVGHELDNLRWQLCHYELDVCTNPRFQVLTSIVDICRWLITTKRWTIMVWLTCIFLFYISVFSFLIIIIIACGNISFFSFLGWFTLFLLFQFRPQLQSVHFQQ